MRGRTVSQAAVAPAFNSAAHPRQPEADRATSVALEQTPRPKGARSFMPETRGRIGVLSETRPACHWCTQPAIEHGPWDASVRSLVTPRVIPFRRVPLSTHPCSEGFTGRRSPRGRSGREAGAAGLEGWLDGPAGRRSSASIPTQRGSTVGRPSTMSQCQGTAIRARSSPSRRLHRTCTVWPIGWWPAV